ncbi:MAG: hypothetical protein HYT97_06575, partial [Elusimicrobia bacterium]|nr:hypothetical protein [Elusimicrobiota bacterium]
IQTSYKPNRTEKIILSIAYLSYPINVLTHHLFNLISNLTRPLGKWRLAPLTQANGTDNKELYYWGTEEQGIKNVKDAINKNEPELLERYAKLDSLGSTAREREKKSLRVKVYKITSAHFQHWGIQRALDKRSAPYFQGSYIRALMVIFPELELEPLDIQLNWSSKEKAIESILYVLLREIPHVVQQYNDLDNFDPAKIEALKNEIYQITSAHFDVWGLGNVTSKKHVPYFNGSYIHALIALFPNLNLDPLGFELDWSSLESGIKSVLYIFKRQVPYLIQDYERFDELTGLELSNLKKEICSITKAHFTSWGLGSAMVQRGAPYFYGSYKNVLISLFPKINLNSLEFQLDWSSEERAIDSMRFVFSSEIPNILRQYDQLEDLSPILIERLKDEIYQISSAHFDVWGLSNATMKKNVPYFNGSYIQALMAVFPDLNLNPLGFQLDWSSKQRAIDSMRFVISRGMPTFIERYENIDGLSAGEVQRLKNEIYSITQGHFVLLGLAKALHRDTVPDFEGSYMKALVELFNHPRLGLSVEGFINFRRTNWQIKYSWRTRDSGIFNIRDALAAYQPALLAKYDRLDSLREEEKNELRNDVYKITQAHFKVWGLSSAVDREKSPYFNGSYIVALMAVFSNLNLNRLGFELDWSSKEKAIESVRYVLSHVMPDLIEQYDHLSNINPHKIRAFRNEIYRITYGHFGLWGLNGAMNQKLVPYFHGSHINVLIALFPKLNLNPLGFKLEWSTKEKGIETIQFIFDREIPSIVQQYERVDQISEDEVEELKNRIYALSEAELKMWGLSRAMHRESAPYFHGSYIEALMAVFPKLDLDPLGFQLDWSTKERALDSIRFVLTHKVPHIMQRYQNIENLNDLELTLLREGIYRIKRAHLLLWKLGAVFSNTYFNDFIELFINLFSHSKLGLTREGFLEKGNGSDDSSGKRVENNSLDNVGNSSSDTSLNDSTDILEPLVQPLQRFKNWQSLRAYYLFVGSWEEGIYRWGGLVGLPFLFSYFGLDFNSGQVLGVVWSSAGFLFSHTIVRWLAKRNSIGWDGWRMELKKDFLSLRSFNALLYNLLFISIISFQPTLVSFALLSVSSFHFTIDMLDAYKKKSLTSQELLSQEIQLIADKLGTSQPELQSLSFDLNLNFSNLVQTLFGVWSKDTKGSELYLVDLTGSRDQSSQIAMLRTIHEIYGLNQNARFILVMDEPKPIEELESILGIKGILSTGYLKAKLLRSSADSRL